MKRSNKIEFSLHQSTPREYNLNKSLTGCAPCLKETLKIERKVDKRSLNEIKIDEIKNIVNSIFKGLNNGYKEN